MTVKEGLELASFWLSACLTPAPQKLKFARRGADIQTMPIGPHDKMIFHNDLRNFDCDLV